MIEVAAIVDKLDELLQATRAGAIPVRERWLDAAGVGAILGREPRYVLERLACRPDFPKPFPDGQPRWLAGEVMDWALEYRREFEKTGRKRRAA